MYFEKTVLKFNKILGPCFTSWWPQYREVSIIDEF